MLEQENMTQKMKINDIDTYFTWKNPDGTPEGIEWFNLLIYTIEEVKKLKQQNIELINRVEQLEQLNT